MVRKNQDHFQRAGLPKERNGAQINVTRQKKIKTEEIKEPKRKEVFRVSENGHPNSCVVEINKTRWRALVDTGAEVSLISENMYRRLKKRPK